MCTIPYVHSEVTHIDEGNRARTPTRACQTTRSRGPRCIWYRVPRKQPHARPTPLPVATHAVRHSGPLGLSTSLIAAAMRSTCTLCEPRKLIFRRPCCRRPLPQSSCCLAAQAAAAASLQRVHSSQRESCFADKTSHPWRGRSSRSASRVPAARMGLHAGCSTRSESVLR